MAALVKRGVINFTVDGVERAMRFSTNAMCAYQEKTGEPFITAMDELSKNSGDMVRLRGLFWAGVDGDVTTDEVGDMIDAMGVMEAVTLIGKAVQAAFPALEAASGNAKGAAKAP